MHLWWTKYHYPGDKDRRWWENPLAGFTRVHPCKGVAWTISNRKCSKAPDVPEDDDSLPRGLRYVVSLVLAGRYVNRRGKPSEVSHGVGYTTDQRTCSSTPALVIREGIEEIVNICCLTVCTSHSGQNSMT